MGVVQIATCDCCGAQLPDTGVLSCTIVTTCLVVGGEVVQLHYGVGCGCSAPLVAELMAAEHTGHVEPEASPQDG